MYSDFGKILSFNQTSIGHYFHVLHIFHRNCEKSANSHPFAWDRWYTLMRIFNFMTVWHFIKAALCFALTLVKIENYGQDNRLQKTP